MCRNRANTFAKTMTKDLGKRFAVWSLKNLGKTVGEVAGASMTTTTVQIGKTAANATERYLGLDSDDGGLGYDKNGNLKFKGGTDVSTAIAKAIASGTIENYTELLGPHISSMGKRLFGWAGVGLEKITPDALSKFFNKVGSSELFKRIGTFADEVSNSKVLNAGKKTLAKVGVNDMPEEGLEEEAGIIINSLITGDNKFSDLWDAETQYKTWGGVMSMMGAMRAIPITGQTVLSAYSASKNKIEYYKLKHDLTKAETKAKEALGDKWTSMKDIIDNADNKHIVEVGVNILRQKGRYSEAQMTAAENYIGQLLKMRGFNNATMASIRDNNAKGEGQTDADKKDIEVSNSYAEGHEAEGELKHQIQLEYEKRKANLAKRIGITPEKLDAMNDEQISSYSGLYRDADFDIFQYRKAKAAYDGVMDNAQSLVDIAGEVAAQRVNNMTNVHDGTIISATMKGTEMKPETPVYIISGNVVQNDDGTINYHDSDKMIVIYNEETGQRETIDNFRLASVSPNVQNAEEVKARAIQEAKQKIINEQSSVIDGRLQQGSEFTLLDAQGNSHKWKIESVDEQGNCIVSMDGTTVPEPMALADVQKQYDQSNAVKSAQNDQVEQENAEQSQQQPVQPIEDTLDYNQIVNENDGKIISVEVTDEEGNNRFPDAKAVFLIQDKGAVPKFMVMDDEGNLTPYIGKRSDKYTPIATQSVEDYKAQRQAELQQMAVDNADSSLIEDNSGEDVEQTEVQPLSEEEADKVIGEMESHAEVAPYLELTPENWVSEFGDDGTVETPLGQVKMGDNQVAKLFEKGRSEEFGMIKPTLQNPDVIIEVPSHSADGNEERSSSYLFIKTFLGKNGEKVYYFKSVTIKKEGLEISISSHYDRAKRVKESLMKGKLLYRKEYDGAQTEQNQPSASVTTSQEGVAGSSDGKDTNNSSNNQENVAKFEDGTPIPVDSEGEVDLSQTDAAHAAEWYDNNLGEDAEDYLNGEINKAKNVLSKAQNLKVKGNKPSELVASKQAKEAAIADAQARLESAISIRDAYKERLIAKEENTPEGRRNLIEKARRKFNRLKSDVKDNAQIAQIYSDTVGSLLHRLYDGTGIDVFDDVPNTVDEYVASNVAPYSLNYEGNENSKGVQQETGLSRSDFSKLGWLAADGKGTTIDAMVHSLWENRPSNLKNADTQEIRNALISLITSGQTAFESRNYIQNQRIAQAENALEEMKRAEENAKFAEEQKAAENEQLDNETEANETENEQINETDSYAEVAPSLTPEQHKAKEEGEKMGFPAVDKEGEPINEFVIELANWAKEQGLTIDPTSKYNSYADLFVMCKDGFGVGMLVPDRGESVNQVVYFPDNVKTDEGKLDYDRLWDLHEEFNEGRDTKHSADMDNELTEGVTFYDGDTAREFKEFVDKKVEEGNKIFGEQQTSVPFSAKSEGKQETPEERAANVEKNKVEGTDVVDAIIGKKTRKAMDRIAKMMGVKIQYQYTDKLGNGWYDASTNTIYLTLDSSITEGVQFIFGHEMTHEIKTKNAEAFEELAKLVKGNIKDFDKAVADMQKRYSKAGLSGYDRAYYEEEVIADGIGYMMRDLNYAHTLAMKMSHPLLAKIHEIINRIRMAFHGTEYTETVKQIMRSIEQAYVKTANGTFESSTSGERFSLKEANERFNNEVEDFKNKSHKGLMHLGAPSPILKACGVNVDEITLSPKVLNRKLNQHSLTSDDVKDLVNAIQKPILVYKHGLGKPNLVIVTNAEVRGNKLSIALELDADGNVVELNNVSSIHDKNANTEVERLLDFTPEQFQEAVRWCEKEKVLDWLSSARLYSHMQTENNQGLSLAKVLNNFDNPKVSEENLQDDSENVKYSLRQKPEPTKKGIGYKVFVLKEGKLYPPMVANPNGAETPVGVWLDADAAPIAGESKTGRPQVKQGGKGTQGGSGKLAYRPGWHLGVIPYALQFNRKDVEGNKTLFPANFVFAEVEYAADKDYQEEARQEGINANGKYQHSLAGLKHLPTDGYYMYRTNPNPETDPWVITGAMKVNRILTRAEQADLVRKAGREPQQIQEGDIVTDEVVNSINQQIANTPKFSLKVYHGSGADFSEFDFDHMGEGAGSQVFGWGGYVTSSEKIGKSYAQISKDTGGKYQYVGKEKLTAEQSRILSAYMGLSKYDGYSSVKEGVEAYIESLNGLAKKNNPFAKHSAERIKVLESVLPKLDKIHKEDFVPYSRNLYEVEIPDDNGSNYLDWGEKLSDDAATRIYEGLYGLDAETLDNMAARDVVFRSLLYDAIKYVDKTQMIPTLVKSNTLTRSTMYDGGNLENTFKSVYIRLGNWMGSPKAASEFLSSLGFTGIRYPAGTIYGGNEEGDTNYVIFKPEDMQIAEHTKFSLKSKPVRFEVGKSLSEDEKKEVLSTLKDAYKVNGVPYHVEETANGKEKRVYEPTADDYVVSDITNRPLRYYITLPDGRVAHPSEVYPNISDHEVKSSAEKQGLADSEAEEMAKKAISKMYDSKVDAKKALGILNELQKLPHETHDVGYGMNNAQSYNYKTGIFTSDAAQAIDYVVRRMRRKEEVSDDVVKAVKKAVADNFGMVDNLINGMSETKVGAADTTDSKYSLRMPKPLLIVDHTKFSLKKVNEDFNKRLDELVKNPNQKDKILRLGRSSSFLKDGGIVDADIELEFDKFVRKSSEKYKNNHPFEASDLKNLPMAIAEPIAVFNSTNANDHVVLTELQKDGKNFIVAIRAVEQHRKGGVVLEVNQITSLYPKEERGIVNWINTGRISNVDKEKALHFIEALQPHAGTSITDEELKSAANVINSFETAKENGEKFSLKDEKTMFGMHNISLDKLRKAIKQGGFAAPSMGVIDSKNGIYSDYGEITLIPKAEKLAKSKGKNAGTFTADAWTPVYPRVQMVQNKGGVDTLINDTLSNNSFDDEIGKSLYNDWKNYIEYGNIEPERFAWQYMQEKGMNPKVEHFHNPYSKSVCNKINAITDNGGKRINQLTEEENGELIKLYNAHLEKIGEGLTEKDVAEIIDYMEEWKANEKVDAFKKNIQKKIDYFKKYGGDVNKAQNWVYQDVLPTIKQGDGVYTEKTFYNAKNKLMLPKNSKMHDDFLNWFEGKLEQYGVEEKLYAGETASGRPKYIPNTVENAVKLMKKQGLEGGYHGGFSNSVGTFIARYAEKTNTLAAMKKAKNKLIPFGDKKHNEVRDEIFNEYHDLANTLKLHYGDAFDDSGEYRMQELAEVKPSDMKGYIKKNWGKEVSDDWVERYNDLVNTIKNDYPVYYFETKFMRPLGLDEFEKAIVPKDTPKDVVDALKKAGIDVHTYEGKEDREKVTMDAINNSDGIKFSLKSADNNFEKIGDNIYRFTPKKSGSTSYMDGEGNLLHDVKFENVNGKKWYEGFREPEDLNVKKIDGKFKVDGLLGTFANLDDAIKQLRKLYENSRFKKVGNGIQAEWQDKGIVKKAKTVKFISESQAQTISNLTGESLEDIISPKFSIRTYHGTGAKFDKFDLSHALEGEGSESFGHGVYVTNSGEIGEEYAKRAKADKISKWMADDENVPAKYRGEEIIQDYKQIARGMFFGQPLEKLKEDAISQYDAENHATNSIIKDLEKDGVPQDQYDMYLYSNKLEDTPNGKEKYTKELIADYKEEIELYDRIKDAIRGMKESDFANVPMANRYDVEIPDDNGQNYLKWHGALPSSLNKDKIVEDAYKVLQEMYEFGKYKATKLPTFQAHILKTYINTLDVDNSLAKLKKDIAEVIANNEADDDVKAMNEYLKDAKPYDVIATIWYNDLINDINDAKNGEQLYRKLENYVEANNASKILSDNGIVGMKYRAGMIHGGAKENDYNYVIYKDSDAKIVGNTKFSLRGSTPYEKQMEEWKKKNRLAEDATPMEKPEREQGEDIFKYMNRMVQYVRDQNLWKTAPKRTNFKEDLDAWKKANGLGEDDYMPVRPSMDDYENEDEYDKALDEYREQKELWKDAPKPRDYDLSVDVENMKKQLRNLHRAVVNQKNYDKSTVKAVSDLANKMLTVGWGDGLSRGRVSRLLSAAKNATGAADVKKHLDNVMNILATNYLHRLETAYDNLIKTKGVKADQSGVIKIGSLDPHGQSFLKEYKKAMNMDDKALAQYVSDIEDNSAKFPEYAEQNDYRLAGIQAAILFKQQIGGNDADIAELENQIRMLRDKKDATKDEKELLKVLKQKLFENKFDRITMYENLLNNIQSTVSDSKSRAKEFKQKIMQHQEDIRHMANIDLEGVDSTYYDTTTAKKKLVNNPLQRAVLSSTYTFEQFLKFFGKHTANGEGRLYNYFTKLNQDALDEEQMYNEMNRKALDDKATEIFGKKTKFNSLVGKSGKGMKEMDIEVADYSNKETGKRTIHLKQGQMLYIYLVNKQTDGQMKLRAMGIDVSDVAAIEANLDPKMKELGEWLQDEYLPSCQRRYQDVHTRFFGAPMKEVENYFPLVVNQRARNVKEDVNQDSEAMSQLAGTSTGAIVTRRVNTIPLDIENADAFAVAYNHLQEMEEWSAMLPFRQDINTLLSYTHFRNQVQNMSSVAYGSGKTLWDEFKQTAQIAAGTYKPKVNAVMMDSKIAAAMGGVAVAKISGRLWTAIKQSQSATVFLPECDFTRFVKNGVNPYGSWKWAKENIPDFRKRVESMTNGDVKLRQYLDELEKWHDWTKTISKIGMAPNILVDGITCAVGARSVYETEVSRLTKLGYPKEMAEEKAYHKAVAAYNKTQQSSGGMYLAPMQVDRTYVSAALSLFKNANYAYGRMQIEACRGLARTYDFWGGKHKTALIESMTRQIKAEDGLDEDTARKVAKAAYNRTFRQSIGRLINFATLVPISWALYKVLPYLLTGDDDDKKMDMIEDAALKGFATSLTDNYAIPFASNILNAGLKWEDGKPTFDPEVFKYQNLYINPATSDLANIYSMIGNQKWYSVANKIGMLGVQSLIGFNPETIGALYQALTEADYDNGNTAKEWQIGILKAISAPEESIRELYMDELGLKNEDIKKVPLEELEKRYAKRQINRDNLLSQIGMDEETFNGYVDKYQQSFEKKIKDKMDKWDEYDKKKADEFFNTTSDPKLKEMIGKKRAKDAETATEEQLQKEGLGEKKEQDTSADDAYDAAKSSLDLDADLTIKKRNKVLDKRYADLQAEYNDTPSYKQDLFKIQHKDFKAYTEMKSAYKKYNDAVKVLKAKLVGVTGYDEKQTILKQIRAERDKFMQLQDSVN